MNRTKRFLLLAAIVTVALASVASADEGERYIVILKQHSGPAPDVTRLGGTIEFRQQEELVVLLPAEAIDKLRQDPLVKYVQRVEAPGEAHVVGTPSEPTAERGGVPSRYQVAETALQPRGEGTLTWDSGVYS